MNKKVFAHVDGPMSMLIVEMLNPQVAFKNKLNSTEEPPILTAKEKKELSQMLVAFYEATKFETFIEKRAAVRAFQLKLQINDNDFFPLALTLLQARQNNSQQIRYVAEVFLIECYAMVYFEE